MTQQTHNLPPNLIHAFMPVTAAVPEEIRLFMGADPHSRIAEVAAEINEDDRYTDLSKAMGYFTNTAHIFKPERTRPFAFGYLAAFKILSLQGEQLSQDFPPMDPEAPVELVTVLDMPQSHTKNLDDYLQHRWNHLDENDWFFVESVDECVDGDEFTDKAKAHVRLGAVVLYDLLGLTLGLPVSDSIPPAVRNAA